MTTSITHQNIRRALPPSWQVLADVANETGRKAVAAELGLSPAIVHKWCESREVSGALNPLDRIEAVTRITGDTRLVEWLCARAGGTFVRDPAPIHLARELHSITGRCGVVLVETLRSITIAAEDGYICPVAEAPEIRSAWQTGKSVVESAVLASESGHYATDRA